MSDRAIEVENLSKQYGQVMAVDRIRFEVAGGALVGLLGPNGAGKSTTMRMLTTFLPATSGIARVCGFDVMTDSMEVRSRLGYLPESVPLYPEMRIEEYLVYRARLKGIPRRKRHARIEYCLERCRIREVRRRLISTLSKGYRQRVGLADAMLADPAVLILDEPTTGLDPIQIRETLSTIKELAGSHTVLLSTHILSEVEAICDRVIIINRGTLRWDGKLASLAEQAPKLVMEVRGPAFEIQSFIEHEPNVAKVKLVSSDKDISLFEIETVNRADLRETLAKRIFEKGWSLRRLDHRRQTLEDLYMSVVLRGDAAGPA
ncbi:MAG: ABC transporter ATP-binding protein [Planctomycetes bacterium]|nr:ABC transporter ATP-binding protein [Planctomycetota bacterium]